MVMLADFLLARIADNEASWRALLDSNPDYAEFYGWMMAECEAKRRIVEMADVRTSLGPRVGVWGACKHLAAVYADHPDYCEEWRP